MSWNVPWNFFFKKKFPPFPPFCHSPFQHKFNVLFEKMENQKQGSKTKCSSDVVSPSGEGNQTSTTLSKGLSYNSCRNENSNALDKHTHGRHSRKYGDKQNMSVSWLDVLLQTKSVPVVPGGTRCCRHQSCAVVQTICRAR